MHLGARVPIEKLNDLERLLPSLESDPSAQDTMGLRHSVSRTDLLAVIEELKMWRSSGMRNWTKTKNELGW